MGTFEKEDSAKQLLKAGTTTVNGVELEVKKVTPKPDPRAMGMMGMGRGGRGAFGGGYGYGDYYGGGYGYGDPYANYGGWGGLAAMVVAGEDLTSRMEQKWVQGEHQEVLQLDKGEQGGVEEGVVQGMSPTKCFVGYLDAWERVRK